MKNLHTALFKARAAFPAIVKDATNPAFRAKYATLGGILDAIDPVLEKHGLLPLPSVRSEPLPGGGLVVFVGLTLVHVESGESITQELGLLPAKTDPQGIGSAITYGRRYMLMTMLGLAAEDDDGNAATFNRAPQPQARPASPPPSKPAPQRPNWGGPPEAQIWAMEMGVYATEDAARAALKATVKRITGRESCKPDELPAVFDAWYTETLAKAKQPAK